MERSNSPQRDDRHHRICADVQRYAGGWARRATEAEAARRLHENTWAELHACGVLDLFTPSSANISSSSAWPTLVEASRIGARACASTGWAIAMLGGHAAIALRTGETRVSRLYEGGLSQRFASASAGSDSQFTVTPDGIHVHGRWHFSTGVDDATWIMLNATCAGYPDGERSEKVMVLIERAYIRSLDSWRASGMCATGSHDIEVDCVVPEREAIPLVDLFGSRVASAPGDYLVRVPIVPYVTTSIIGPLLGATEGARDSWLNAERKAARKEPLDGRTAERIAHVDARLSLLGKLYESLVSTLHEAGLSGSVLNDSQLLQLRRDRAYLARQCVQVTSLLVEDASASTFKVDSVVQRQWRDIQVMASHRDVAWAPAMAGYGDELLRCTAVAEHMT